MGSTTDTFNLFQKQKECLREILNFNRPADNVSLSEGWKVLIYDKETLNILTPLFTSEELHSLGVTLHLPLHSDRQSIPDVPAVYFVSSTPENIKRIVEDCAKRLYESFYLNFSSSLSQELTDELVTGSIASDSVKLISKVFDQYTNFVTLDKDLFELHHKNSYLTLNSPKLTEMEATHIIDSITEGLFSVIISLGVIPIIRCPKTGVAEMIASKLEARLREHLNSPSNLLLDSSIVNFQRPVLILLDRNIDLSVMVSHTWTYQTLLHDLLDMKLNGVTIMVEEEGDGSGGKTVKESKKTYSLDPIEDTFWANNMSSPFPKVAVEVQSELNDYKSKMEEIEKIKASDNSAPENVIGNTQRLGKFVVESLPELRARKKKIDLHTNIAHALLERIKKREIDSYFSLEEKILLGLKSAADKKEIISLITGEGTTSKGTEEDRLRLFLVYYLSGEKIENAEIEALLANFTDASFLKYLKKVRSLVYGSLSSDMSLASSASSGYRGQLMQKGYDSLSGLFSAIHTGVKFYLPTSKELYITKIVDALMDMKPTTGSGLASLNLDSYLYLDPKIPKMANQGSIPRKNSPFKEAIVFVIGGGNYVEYQNLLDYVKATSVKSSKKIIYGTSELVTANDFVRQLKELGHLVS
eukprot:TRINITY_DN3663_c0_g1_i1.p1 TRINITY_DN3663_c0_g1~~TRINITY_DN3663_c0_g1_i1.p1  ORF type:complete len:642 (-),score=150.36 TRINITY_DN3663_c0_g1_i1:195-2120(-)